MITAAKQWLSGAVLTLGEDGQPAPRLQSSARQGYLQAARFCVLRIHYAFNSFLNAAALLLPISKQGELLNRDVQHSALTKQAAGIAGPVIAAAAGPGAAQALPEVRSKTVVDCTVRTPGKCDNHGSSSRKGDPLGSGRCGARLSRGSHEQDQLIGLVRWQNSAQGCLPVPTRHRGSGRWIGCAEGGDGPGTAASLVRPRRMARGLGR